MNASSHFATNGKLKYYCPEKNQEFLSKNQRKIIFQGRPESVTKPSHFRRHTARSPSKVWRNLRTVPNFKTNMVISKFALPYILNVAIRVVSLCIVRGHSCDDMLISTLELNMVGFIGLLMTKQ